MMLDEAVRSVPELKEFIASHEQAKEIIDIARRLEGVARHTSVHACGVVITPEPLTEYVPCQYASPDDKTVITQYSLHPIEDLGLLKFDFLGLSNLTILEHAKNLVSKTAGITIDYDTLPLEDKKTYKLLQEGRTTGVFQLESAGMKRYLKMLKPSVFEDLIAMVALYRPGPLNSGMVDEFIARKHGQKEITYLHPAMANSLKNTYGVIVYQEQVMQLSKDMAGFTGGQADTLRKAMGKKIAALMEKMKAEFLAGCAKNNISAEIATATFGSMEKFAEYGFNKSHAACYALIAYQTGYLKANYPTEFMAALLTSDQHNMDRITIEIDECKQMGIKIFAPSINESYSTFTVVAESLAAKEPRIRFGLNAVRNVGEAVAKSIIHERKERGVYNDLESFLSRLGGQMINKKSLEGLIKSGAMDMFGRRSQLLDNVEKMTLFTKESESAKSSKQVNLFSLNNDTSALPRLVLRESPDFGIAQILAWEKEFLGLYVSEHPFTPYARALQNLIMPLGTLFAETITKRVVRIGGVVSTIKKITTKKGEPMLFVTLEDHVHSVECLVFPRLYKAKESVWQKGTIVVTEGTLSDKDGEAKVLCNKVWELNNDNLDQVAAAIKKSALEGGVMAPGGGQRVPKRQVIISYPLGASKDFANQVKMLFMEMPGDHQVIFQIQDKMIKTNFLINLNDDNRFKLEKVLGPDSLRHE